MRKLNQILITTSIIFHILLIILSQYSPFYFIFLEGFFSIIIFHNLFNYKNLIFSLGFFPLFTVTLIIIVLIIHLYFHTGGLIILILSGGILLKQILGLFALFFLKSEYFHFSYIFYYMNSEFSFLWLIMYLLDSPNIREFFFNNLVCSNLFLFIIYLLWVIYFILFQKYLVERDYCKFVFTHFLYSQLMLVFFVGIGVEILFICFWVDTFLFTMLFFLYLNYTFQSRVLGVLDYLFYIIMLSFFLSFPPFPNFYLEMKMFRLYVNSLFTLSLSIFTFFYLLILFFSYFSTSIKIFHEVTSERKKCKIFFVTSIFRILFINVVILYIALFLYFVCLK